MRRLVAKRLASSAVTLAASPAMARQTAAPTPCAQSGTVAPDPADSGAVVTTTSILGGQHTKAIAAFAEGANELLDSIFVGGGMRHPSERRQSDDTPFTIDLAVSNTAAFHDDAGCSGSSAKRACTIGYTGSAFGDAARVVKPRLHGGAGELDFQNIEDRGSVARSAWMESGSGCRAQRFNHSFKE